MSKRLFWMAMVVFFLVGCGATVRKSEFYDHSSHYKSFDHLMFSWGGYKNVTKQDVQKSTAENWWGCPVVGIEK